MCIQAVLDTMIEDGSGEYTIKVGMASGTVIYMSDTPEELGEKLGYSGEDLDNFVASVERYNELCEAGKDDDLVRIAA